jgi:hypothetical protein
VRFRTGASDRTAAGTEKLALRPPLTAANVPFAAR